MISIQEAKKLVQRAYDIGQKQDPKIRVDLFSKNPYVELQQAIKIFEKRGIFKLYQKILHIFKAFNLTYPMKQNAATKFCLESCK